MTATLTAPCGLDCAQCEAYKLTQTNDLEGQEALLAKWRVEYSSPDMPLAAVSCDGCLAGARHGGYCSACPIRACAVEKDYSTCAECDQYASCEKLQNFFKLAPQAQSNLELLRK